MEKIRIYCVTWNVQVTWPKRSLKSLLGLSEDIKNYPDIYVICLQEVNSQPQNYIMDAMFEEPWTTSFRETLGPFGYVRIAGERLQGIVSSIFVRRSYVPHLRDVHTIVTRTGLRGYWGNKGGVCVRFSLYGCSLCFVNSHLAAHDNGYSERCDNYNAIIDQTNIPVEQTSNILFHDYVFWLGDLNFRLMDQETPEEIFSKIKSKDLTSLLDKDELMTAQSRGDAFGPLTEACVTFPPTYKCQIGSAEYDLSRRPAWTDRILHQVHIDAYENVKLNLTQLNYESKSEYDQSDHKPVVASYDVQLFANYTERCVIFKPIKSWQIGNAHSIRYTLEADVLTSPWDYIAMFKASFTSTQQYLTYTYVPQVKREANESVSNGQGPSIPMDKTLELKFNDELVQTPGLYVLLYYSAKYSSYLGMSDPFPVTEL